MSEPSELAALAERHGTRFILALFVDLNGKPCAKLVPVEAIGQLVEDGAGFAGYAVGAIGQTPKDPDLIAVPDPASFTPVPFVKEGLALVHCDPHVNGEPWPFAPRVILKSVLAKAGEAGFSVYAGAEVEYFLLRKLADGTLITADSDDEASQPCYDARGVTRMYDHLASISRAMNDLGWGNYANDHEDGNGQFEQNFTYADALTTADRVVTLRYLLSVMAAERGMIATFMPKPFANRTGSGLHLHLSLRDATGQTAVFPRGAAGRDAGDAAEDTAEDKVGLGLSDTAYSFVAGILEHAAALQAVIAPTVNSYKRTGAVAASASGATWAPRLPTYGGNDRTHYVRIPDDQRIELRGGDGSANPYLAVAAAVGAGLAGIEAGLELGPIGTGPDTPFPPTLVHAVEALEADKVVTSTLDVAGPGVAEYFARLKKDEFYEYHAAVAPWEIDRYLTAF